MYSILELVVVFSCLVAQLGFVKCALVFPLYLLVVLSHLVLYTNAVTAVNKHGAIHMPWCMEVMSKPYIYTMGCLITRTIAKTTDIDMMCPPITT